MVWTWQHLQEGSDPDVRVLFFFLILTVEWALAILRCHPGATRGPLAYRRVSVVVKTLDVALQPPHWGPGSCSPDVNLGRLRHVGEHSTGI